MIDFKFKKSYLLAAIVFVAYNVILFAIAGFTGHTASFWISYSFLVVAFLAVATVAYFLKIKTPQTKDWLLGYPAIKHTFIYVVTEFILSTAFMILDSIINLFWAVSFSVQVVAFAFYLVMVISCFIAQDTIVGIQNKVKTSTSFIKFLQADLQVLANKARNEEVKTAFNDLVEAVRFSDPVSNPNLAEIEKKITFYLNEAENAINVNDAATAIHYGELVKQTLDERNIKCKALK